MTAPILPPGDVMSFMPHLTRAGVYKTEKPYGADFLVDHIDGAIMTNHTFEVHPITFRDIRNRKESLALDVNGCCLMKVKTALRPEEASDSATPAMGHYAAEILAALQRECPEFVEMRLMDFQVGCLARNV